MDQFVLIPFSLYNKFNQGKIEKVVQSQNNPSEKDHVPNLDLIYKQLFTKTKTKQVKIVEEILNSPRVKLSLENTIILDNRDTGVSLVDFVFKLKKQKESLPDIYLTILDAINLHPSFVSNKHAKETENGSWIPFNF